MKPNITEKINGQIYHINIFFFFLHTPSEDTIRWVSSARNRIEMPNCHQFVHHCWAHISSVPLCVYITRKHAHNWWWWIVSVGDMRSTEWFISHPVVYITLRVDCPYPYSITLGLGESGPCKASWWPWGRTITICVFICVSIAKCQRLNIRLSCSHRNGIFKTCWDCVLRATVLGWHWKTVQQKGR